LHKQSQHVIQSFVPEIRLKSQNPIMFKVKYSHRQKERSKDNAKSWGQPTHTLPRKSWPK